MTDRAFNRRFLLWWSIALAVLVLLAAMVNFLVDPYGFFGTSLGTLNEVKPRPDANLGSLKRVALERAHPTALILGNSRAEIGFDPEHPVWKAHGLNAFNLAVPGDGITATWQNLRWASKHTKLKAVLVGLDFADFIGVPNWTGDDVGLSDQPAVSPAAKAKALLSLTALRYSIQTLRLRTDPYAATMTPRGFNPLSDYVPIARQDGYYVMFRQRADDNARRFIQEPESTTFSFERANASANEALRRMIELCRAEGIDLYLVIYPYHAQMQLLFYEANLWSGFERWKRYLASVAGQARSSGQARIQLWDFSGIHQYSTEAVPVRGDRTSQLTFYWEAGHFKKALGDRVLDRMLNGGADYAKDFGVALMPDNVDAHITAQREALLTYRETHPEMAAEVRDIVDAQCRINKAIAQPARCPARSSLARDNRPGQG